MATIDARELMAFRLAMGEGREYENARHEAEGTGCKSVSGLEDEISVDLEGQIGASSREWKSLVSHVLS